MAKGPQQGDRYGDWYLESRAKPQDGKRMWNVTNTRTDEALVVAQTELKNLENDVPTSAEITARVLAGNHAGNPFAMPAAAFEPVFREPAITDLDSTPTEGCPADDACEIIDGRHVVEHSNPFAFASNEGPDVNEPTEDLFKEGTIDSGEPYMVDLEVIEAAEDDLRAAIRECMMHIADAQNSLDRVLKLVVNQ